MRAPFQRVGSFAAFEFDEFSRNGQRLSCSKSLDCGPLRINPETGSLLLVSESEVRDALRAFDPLWNQLFPAEQSRIIQLLVERVDVLIDRVDIKLRIAGVTSLIGELTDNSTIRRDAA